MSIKNEIGHVIKRLLDCSDGKHIEEIYAKTGSIVISKPDLQSGMVNGEFGNFFRICYCERLCKQAILTH